MPLTVRCALASLLVCSAQIVLAQAGLRSVAVDVWAHNKSRQVVATAGLKAAEKSVRSIVGVMDSVLTPALKSNPVLLADWLASKRVPQTIITPISTGGEVADAAKTAA